jgi:hypothetical protein
MRHALQEGEDEAECRSKHIEQKDGAGGALHERPDPYVRECEHGLGAQDVVDAHCVSGRGPCTSHVGSVQRNLTMLQTMRHKKQCRHLSLEFPKCKKTQTDGLINTIDLVLVDKSENEQEACSRKSDKKSLSSTFIVSRDLNPALRGHHP